MSEWTSIGKTRKRPKGYVIGWVLLPGVANNWAARGGMFSEGKRPWTFRQDEHNHSLQVTHWMPLPESPEDTPNE